MSSTSDPSSYIEAALEELKDILATKNQDYRIDEEFSNFTNAAYLADVGVMDVLMVQVGIKLRRLKGARGKGSLNHESYRDTVRDLAGYAVIMYAYLTSEEL